MLHQPRSGSSRHHACGVPQSAHTRVSVRLSAAGAGNRSVDVATLPSPLGEPTKTLQQFKQLFEGTPGNCNYSINDRTLPGAEWACR